MAGFEPTNARVKVWCLTAWRHPNEMLPADGHTEHYNTVKIILQHIFVASEKNYSLIFGKNHFSPL